MKLAVEVPAVMVMLVTPDGPTENEPRLEVDERAIVSFAGALVALPPASSN